MHRVASAADAISLSASGGDGLAMPDDEDDVVGNVTRTASAVTWWTVSSTVLCIGLLLHSGFDVPWFVAVIVFAEILISLARLWGQLVRSGAKRSEKRRHRLRHFMSVRLHEGAPVDELVASFLSLDQMECVKSLEVGSNCSRAAKSREHQLAFLVTFRDQRRLNAFLASSERAAFLSTIAPYTTEEFVFDFESGVMT
ncbi:hypothetical protein AB1Y20_021869 [Prymnesium parvum]|uniref:Stress-response A/B barrel domain-containing protein n=1 Tax=Prymnesium parvum TaxID=97485 RepID=A0AB34JMQ5_PRYPA|mmetsp:Transcript_25412/g.61450  ORF Transcript_25412/g.61450 Transcript_25412/m.61450 type:complete len:198 (+) Transcript_25412:34-627(+)